MPPLSNRKLQRLADLFDEALALPDGPRRESWLRQACAGDLSLEARVRRLLESDGQLRSRTMQERLPRFGLYQARELIGTGGMGAVYRATREDGDIQQEVA